MAGTMTVRRLALLLVVAVTAFGCSTAKQVLGVPNAGDPSVAIKSAETRWLLIRNPRFGDVPSEPEYVWVEEDKTPVTLGTVVFGKSSIIASPRCANDSRSLTFRRWPQARGSRSRIASFRSNRSRGHAHPRAGPQRADRRPGRRRPGARRSGDPPRAGLTGAADPGDGRVHRGRRR